MRKLPGDAAVFVFKEIRKSREFREILENRKSELSKDHLAKNIFKPRIISNHLDRRSETKDPGVQNP